MQVNDLIFKELIKRGYSLQGKTRIWNIADSKLWYLTPEQAQAYLSLDEHKDYSKSMFQTEINMLKEFIPKIYEGYIKNHQAVNVIDIGCGDGKKAIPILEGLNGKVKLRYFPIDISGFMVSKAIDNVKKMNIGEVVEFRWNISDFENLENVASLLLDKEFRNNFFLFLGSTVSNFEFHEVMHEISEAVGSVGDILLLGVAMRKDDNIAEDIIKSYKSKKVDDFLSLILTNIGFKRNEIEFGVRYEHHRMEAFYTVKTDKTIQIGDQKIKFMTGDQILVAISRRYTKKELDDYLSVYFKNRTFLINKEKNWALVLCKK